MKNYYTIAVFAYWFSFITCTNNAPAITTKTIENQSDMTSYTVKLKLVDNQDKPIADALASVSAGPASFPEIAVMSDDEGQCKLTCGDKEGVYTVTVFVEGQKKIFNVEASKADSVHLLVW
jgi:spore germination protein GerM